MILSTNESLDIPRPMRVENTEQEFCCCWLLLLLFIKWRRTGVNHGQYVYLVEVMVGSGLGGERRWRDDLLLEIVHPGQHVCVGVIGPDQD